MRVSPDGNVSMESERHGAIDSMGSPSVQWEGKKVGLHDPLIEPAGASTMLAGRQLWVGTIQNGLWRYDGRTWDRITAREEPHNHNIQGLALVKGHLLAMTLDQGIAAYDGVHWEKLDVGDPRPRQVVTFKGSTYTRCANGSLWSDDAQKLPAGVFALEATVDRLFAGQWGGWSEFDGRIWTARHPEELSGIIVTALSAHEGQLFIGTQGSGLGVYEGGVFRWIDRGLDLGDDWITTLCHDGAGLWIGTFVGGLSKFEKGNIEHFRETNGKQITALASKGGVVWIGTRFGLLQLREGRIVSSRVASRSEVQALLFSGPYLWIGTRTCLLRTVVLK